MISSIRVRWFRPTPSARVSGWVSADRMVDSTAMKTLRVIDETGSKADYEAEFVPRIGERILLNFGRGKDAPVTEHFYRVKDVMYRLDNPAEAQVAIYIEEDLNPKRWPS